MGYVAGTPIDNFRSGVTSANRRQTIPDKIDATSARSLHQRRVAESQGGLIVRSTFVRRDFAAFL